jgi:hypothetical protein
MEELLRARYHEHFQKYRSLWEEETKRIVPQPTSARQFHQHCCAIDIVLTNRLPAAERL